ncbi:MAG: NUDIX hydrolase [Chitinophagaceae bacterium]|nr:NUDIX hydrolase [Chitinophagaceae bacterium]
MAQKELKEFIDNASQIYLSHLSLDCVVFGFHDGQLKVLLLKMKNSDRWSLPGGFIKQAESMETAAIRVLNERTGLDSIFLQQFHVFSDPGRSDNKEKNAHLRRAGIAVPAGHWFMQRFLSVGFYALVDFSTVTPQPDAFSDDCAWWDIGETGQLILDHSRILFKALEVLRLQLHYQPIGYNLLPPKFTMPELQKLYETILGRKLDRRNFHRKILSYEILRPLKEKRQGVAHKAPQLYSFDTIKYQKALKEGLGGI